MRTHFRTSLFVMVSGTAAAALLALSFPAAGAAFRVILVAGQSNAVGFDTNVAALPADPVDGSIPFFFDVGDPPYDAGVNDSSSGGMWTTLGPQPKGNPLPSGSRQYGNFASVTGGFGPEMAIARDLYAAGLADLAVVKFAYSGTSFSAGDWHKGNPLYDNMLARYQTAAALLADGGTNTVGLDALFWIQGESDSGSATYQADFTSFVANLRADYAAPSLQVYAGLKTDFSGSTGTVVAAQQAVAAADPNVVYVDTSGAAAANSAHFSSAGTLDVGSRFASAYLQLNGLAPVTPPAAAVVANPGFETGGWTPWARDYSGSGNWPSDVFNPNAAHFADGAAHGGTYNMWHNFGAFYQTLDATALPNTRYTLSAWQNQALNRTEGGGGAWIMQLLAGDNVIGQLTGNIDDLVADLWVERVLEVETGAGLLPGQLLEVRFISTADPANGYPVMVWDDVAITATAVPEPASFAALLLAGLALCRRTRP